jgi:hypothetical protein
VSDDLLLEAVAIRALAGQRLMQHAGQGVDVGAGVGVSGVQPLG